MEFDLGRLLTEESKRMMNCLHEGIFIADKMGNIVFANQALLEMAGGTEEYALSLNVFDFKKQGVDVNKDQLLAQRALETKRRITRISEVKITSAAPVAPTMGRLRLCWMMKVKFSILLLKCRP